MHIIRCHIIINFVYSQILMNAVKALMAVGRSASTQLDCIYVAVILDIGLALTYMNAMVLLIMLMVAMHG